MLRPGLHLLRRDIRTWQLGFEWPGLATVEDTPAVRAVLSAVDGFRDLTGVLLAATAAGVTAEEAAQAVDALVDAGALVDQAPHKPVAVADASWAAMWLLAGPASSGHAVAAARKRARVHLVGSGVVASVVRSLLAEERIAMTTNLVEATLGVLVSDGELSRELADDAMRRGLPFLCVAMRELVGLVGPFVIPGHTACLRCTDLSMAQVDPCWPTLVDSARVRPPTTPAGPPTLLSVTAAYAAQEIALWASGARPVSWNRMVEIPHGLGEVSTVSFPPHPACGCGWLGSHDTMSA